MGTKRKSIDDKLTRALRFLSLLMNARAPTPYTAFQDESRWGSDRNMKRFLTDVNADWERVMGAPLFAKIKIEGRMYLTLADEAFAKMPERRVTVMAATMEFMKTLRGTLIEDELKPINDGFAARLSATDRRKLTRIQSKFFYIGKGQKDYSREPLKSILDEIYTALTKECELLVSLERDNELEERTLNPLSLVLFNNSLYLVASVKGGKTESRPHTYRLEAFAQARALIKSKISQLPFDPAAYYKDYFGLSTGDGNEKISKIVLEIANNVPMQRYIQERRWSAEDKYQVINNGKLRLTMKLKITNELIPWVLGMGPNVKVIEPASLKAEIAAACKAMAKIY